MTLFVITLFFFYKQKTASEWRISDWSSDVCSSDLHPGEGLGHRAADQQRADQTGPQVTAIPSRSPSRTPASASARSTTGTITSMWRREASSGTTDRKSVV